MKHIIAGLVALALAACGGDPTAPAADPPVITLGAVSVDRGLSFGQLTSVIARVTVSNTGGPGRWALKSVADSARANPCSLTPLYSSLVTAGKIAAGARVDVVGVTYCPEKLDYLVLYGGTGENLNRMPPRGCYAIGIRPCPALSAFVQP